jgi:hypothetical protein
MTIKQADILGLLDRCANEFTFPMLDNGYHYLAASRLSLFRSVLDWAIVMETFTFSPRAGFPSLQVETFASTLYARDLPERYVSRLAYEQYIGSNPHNEARFFYPIEPGAWQDVEDLERVALDGATLTIRGIEVSIPSKNRYAELGIPWEDPAGPRVYELCRWLAADHREKVLATRPERRVSLAPEVEQILQLEEWYHPDLAAGEHPSSIETFQQLAKVLETGNTDFYRPTCLPNTHWINWPEAGLL